MSFIVNENILPKERRYSHFFVYLYFFAYLYFFNMLCHSVLLCVTRGGRGHRYRQFPRLLCKLSKHRREHFSQEYQCLWIFESYDQNNWSTHYLSMWGSPSLRSINVLKNMIKKIALQIIQTREGALLSGVSMFINIRTIWSK